MTGAGLQKRIRGLWTREQVRDGARNSRNPKADGRARGQGSECGRRALAAGRGTGDGGRARRGAGRGGPAEGLAEASRPSRGRGPGGWVGGWKKGSGRARDPGSAIRGPRGGGGRIVSVTGKAGASWPVRRFISRRGLLRASTRNDGGRWLDGAGRGRRWAVAGPRARLCRLCPACVSRLRRPPASRVGNSPGQPPGAASARTEPLDERDEPWEVGAGIPPTWRGRAQSPGRRRRRAGPGGACAGQRLEARARQGSAPSPLSAKLQSSRSGHAVPGGASWGPPPGGATYRAVSGWGERPSGGPLPGVVRPRTLKSGLRRLGGQSACGRQAHIASEAGGGRATL